MTKFISLLVFAVFFQTSFSQTTDCSCNELFDKDLRTKYASYNAQNSKLIILKYFKSNQVERQEMKNDASIEGSVSTIIKQLPIDFGFSGSTSRSSNKYFNLYKEVIENNYVSDENLQSLSISIIPDSAFDSYNKCLILCGATKNGITLRNVSTQQNLVVLELRFNSIPAGGKIKIKDAIYSSGTIIGDKKFEKETEIIDGQTLYEHIKLRPDEDFTVSVSFIPGVAPASLSISKSKIKKSTDTPIGTIVSSMLNYQQFLEVNGLKFEGDINKTIWVPCDGRDIGSNDGTYGAYSGGKAPDLRGLFLRAVNDMGAYTATVPTPISANLNPENKKAGQVQQDANKSHTHGITTYAGKEARSGGSIVNVWLNDRPTRTQPDGAAESRPKNVSVYYYIKIR